VIVSHWVLVFLSHPIPFPSFSWRSTQWTYGHPLPPDLPLLFAGWPKVGLGLYNRISAVQATALELTRSRRSRHLIFKVQKRWDPLGEKSRHPLSIF